jgi:hypothetical protein
MAFNFYVIKSIAPASDITKPDVGVTFKSQPYFINPNVVFLGAENNMEIMLL